MPRPGAVNEGGSAEAMGAAPVDDSYLRQAARKAIYRALADELDEPEPLQRWRGLQIDKAIVEYLKGEYGPAIALAERARSSPDDIPVEELGIADRQSVDELCARMMALREFFGL